MIREFISLSYYQLIISKPRLKYDKLTVYIKYNQEHESWLSYRLGIDTVQSRISRYLRTGPTDL